MVPDQGHHLRRSRAKVQSGRTPLCKLHNWKLTDGTTRCHRLRSPRSRPRTCSTRYPQVGMVEWELAMVGMVAKAAKALHRNLEQMRLGRTHLCRSRSSQQSRDTILCHLLRSPRSQPRICSIRPLQARAVKAMGYPAIAGSCA